MESVVLTIFNSLVWSMLHSLWVAAVLYTLLILAFRFFIHTPKVRALLSLLILIGMGILFLASLVYCTLEIAKISISGALKDISFIQLDSTNNQFSPTAWIESYFPFVAVVYLLGVSFQTVGLIKGYRNLRFIRTNGLSDVTESWTNLLADKTRQLGLRKPIRLYLSSLVDVPVIIGHLKPVVLFPVALSTNLTIPQVEALLLHELAHIKRHDYLVNYVKILVEILLFFNPFVWLIGKILEEEREKACDDDVVELTGQPLEYARVLLQLEQSKKQVRPHLVMQALPKKKQLLGRIKRITKEKEIYLIPRQHLAFIAVFVIGFISLFLLNMSTKDSLLLTSITSEPAIVEIDRVYDMEENNLKEDFNPVPLSTNILKGETSTSHKTMVHKAVNVHNIKKTSLKDIPADPVEKYVDSIKIYFKSEEWISKVEEWKQETKDVDTTLQLKNMTLFGNKRDVEQLMEGTRLTGYYNSMYRKEFEENIRKDAETKKSVQELFLSKRDKASAKLFAALNKAYKQELESFGWKFH